MSNKIFQIATKNEDILTIIAKTNKWLTIKKWIRGWEIPIPVSQVEYSSDKDLSNFGGNANEAFQRDEYQCVSCGSKRHLLIHHLDGKSVYSKNRDKLVPNNIVGNFLTLCFFCHKRTHGKYPADIYDAIHRYISFFQDAKVQTPSKEPARILDYQTGSIVNVRVMDERTTMFYLDDLFFPEWLLEKFMKYVKSVYESHCFNCKADISSHTQKKCVNCGWFVCSECDFCGCLYGKK